MRQLVQHIADKGFFYTTSAVSQPPGTLARGSKNLIRLARWIGWKGTQPLGGGLIGSRFMANIPNGSFGGLGDKTTAGIGSIVGLIARAIGFIGAGPLYLTGVSRAVSASTAFQIILYRAGSYFGANTGPYTAGLDPPSAPTIAEHSVTTSTINSGTTSVRLHFVRSATGGRSRASTPSATIVVTNKKVRVTVQSADLTYASTVGADRLGINVPQWGFGFSGPHYEYIEIAISSLTTVDGVPNSYELEYSSGDLIGKPLAPIDDFPPPAGVFAVGMEDVVAIIGCYGDSTSGVTATSPGTGIAVSLPVFIESFPPDNLLFLPEAPVGVISRAADGFSFIGCKNSMHALLYTGGQPALSLRTIWPGTGIQAAHNMCLGEGGRLYVITSERGLVRIGESGEPETEWAEAVADIISTWTLANVVLVWDNDHQCVVVAHDKTMLSYNVQRNEWGTPLDATSQVTGSFCAGVTNDGEAILSSNDGSADIGIYGFNRGSGTKWEAVFPSVPTAGLSDDIFEVRGMARFDNIFGFVEVRIYKNEASAIVSAAQSKIFTPTATGPQHLPNNRLRFNVRDAKSFQLYIAQVAGGSDCGPDVVSAHGVTYEIL